MSGQDSNDFFLSLPQFDPSSPVYFEILELVFHVPDRDGHREGES